MFWKANNSRNTSITAGCLESPTGLSLEPNIYLNDKGDYYDLDDEIPASPQSD